VDRERGKGIIQLGMGCSKMAGNTAMKGWIENEARELFSWTWAARKWPEIRVDRERGKEMSKMGGNTAMKGWIENEARELFSWAWAGRKWPEIRQ
jgi:hypothetical protein